MEFIGPLEKEVWLPVKGFEDRFRISNHGKLYSSKSKKVLKTFIRKDGYETVSVSVNNKKLCFRIHRLVAEAFIPNPENKPDTNHIDLVRNNNYYKNLEWNTESENIEYSYSYGNKIPSISSAKLSREDIEYCRKNYIPGDTYFGTRGLARRFNVSHATISRLLNNKSWK